VVFNSYEDGGRSGNGRDGGGGRGKVTRRSEGGGFKTRTIISSHDGKGAPAQLYRRSFTLGVEEVMAAGKSLRGWGTLVAAKLVSSLGG